MTLPTIVVFFLMNIFIAPDKFKGSLTSREVCDVISLALRSIHPNVVITMLPLADGGEGTCELLTHLNDGVTIHVDVSGPDFQTVNAQYGISKDGTTAFIEMAKASGLQLLSDEKRNPLYTTSLGTGEIIKHALDRGVKRIVLGIGGSATNDAGIGMASALGFEFLDGNGETLKPIGKSLVHLQHIKPGAVHPHLEKLETIVLCDVANFLYGEHGAAVIYGPQKGADEKAIALLDAGLRQFQTIAQNTFHIDVNFPGAGAAGGMGAGAKVFLHASIQKGMDYIIRSTGLRKKILSANLIITGEGTIDRQTSSGKVVGEVSRLASMLGKPVLALCGKCELNIEELKQIGIQKVIPLVNESTSEEEAMRNTPSLIRQRIIEELKDLHQVTNIIK